MKVRFWAENSVFELFKGIQGCCKVRKMSICQMGGPEPKTYPSKPSETQAWFFKFALSGRGISKSHYCLKHHFWPKNALFCTRTTSVGVKIVIFCFEKTLTYPWTRFRLILGRFAPIFSEGRSKVFLAPMKPYTSVRDRKEKKKKPLR